MQDQALDFPRELSPLPRIAITREDAAATLGMSLRSFETYVQPSLPILRLGRMRLVPVAALERWAVENAEQTLPT
jgi:hypothetical protein